MLETALIEAHGPLLNRRGRGYTMSPPIQLRAIGHYEPERAWWLFNAAWLAVLTLESQGWTRRSRTRHVVATDPEGWPTPLDVGITRKIKIPTERSAQRMLAQAAPSALRSQIANTTPAAQASAWWAAYAGHAFLREPQSHDVALRGALACSPEGHHAPPKLPSVAKTAALVALIRDLPRLSH